MTCKKKSWQVCPMLPLSCLLAATFYLSNVNILYLTIFTHSMLDFFTTILGLKALSVFFFIKAIGK
jgi:hypothetical protein